MRFHLILTSLLYASSLPSACEPVTQQETKIVVVDRVVGPEIEIAAIRATAEKMVAALKQGDVDALVVGFTDDAVIIPPGHPVLRGKDAIRVFYRSQLDQFELLDFAPSLDELVIAGDWAFSRGTSVVVGMLRDHDESITMFNRGMEIWEKQADGSWKMARAVGNR
jgi:ketosteroid isomerase-like protein